MPTVYTPFDDLGQMLQRKRGTLPVTEGDGKFPGIGLVVAPEASADGASPNGGSNCAPVPHETPRGTFHVEWNARFEEDLS